MSDWLTIIILGIVEGITEFLPVSSTGHLLIAEHWLPRQSDLFNVVIQCGAVIAVLPLFPERLRQVFFRWREPATRDFVFKLLTAFVITGIGGVILEKFHFKLPEKVVPIALALLIGGVLFVLVERWLKNKESCSEVTWQVAVAVGLGQLLAAVFPGTSRSGATILIMLALGMNRVAATEFSFLVGIPTMMAAGGLKIFKALHHPPPGVPPENWTLLLVCTLISAIVSFIAVKWLLRFVQTHTFVGFGWYRVAAGAGLLLFLR
ncbi:MAG: undecaprenyl-diphosphate phosphatase [Verrucomicrobia bacterium]|nr:undecaprenyl-diphosphate phosphatase [Verrucomicrobiota bacterium]